MKDENENESQEEELAEMLDEFKKDVDRDYNAAKEAIESAEEDTRFIGVDGGMWEGFLENIYDDSRVKLELDVTSPYVMRFIGERNLNRTNVVFTPDDKSTTDDDAELLNGVYRADFKDNDGKVSQDNAVFETAVCGCGAFKLSTQFVDEEDPENEDQEVIFSPIINAYSHVLWDETATRADKKDARHCTVLTAHSKEAFECDWPDAKPVSAFNPETNMGWRWYTRDVIYVAERYEVKQVSDKVQVWRNIEQNEVKAFELKDMEMLKPELEATGWEFVRERELKRRTVWKTIFSGDQILQEEKRIAGKYIPIIPMYGVRSYVNNQENYRGLVRKLKDANRVLNTSVSRMTEDSSTSGGSLPILSRAQVKSDLARQSWADKTKASFLLLDDVLDANGNPMPPTNVPMLPPNQVDPNTLSVIDIISNFVQRETGNAPQDQLNPDASGKAIDSLRERENLNTQLITDNIHQSIIHSGRVYESMAADVYTQSRMKKIIGKDRKAKMVQLNQPSLHPQTGNPITLNDISRGRFSVDIEIGPQYESQKAATIGSIERVIEKVGQDSPLQPALVGAWIENIEGTGLDGVKAQNRKIMLMNGTAKPETPEEEQMVQQAQGRTDPQQELVKAATQQQLAEAENLKASSMGKMAQAQKDAATAEKTKAETAEIVTDIGIKRSEQAFNQFVQATPQRFRYNPQTGGLESAGNRAS